jgi:hypothetical protein
VHPELQHLLLCSWFTSLLVHVAERQQLCHTAVCPHSPPFFFVKASLADYCATTSSKIHRKIVIKWVECGGGVKGTSPRTHPPPPPPHGRGRLTVIFIQHHLLSHAAMYMHMVSCSWRAGVGVQACTHSQACTTTPGMYQSACTNRCAPTQQACTGRRAHTDT